MDALQYKVIKTEAQYYKYCKGLEDLVVLKRKTKNQQDLIDLLTLLIEKWDEEHNTFGDADPIELLRSLMTDHKLKSADLAKLLGISKSLMSDILNYRRGLSKDIIRKVSERFKLRQEAFNRPYKLVSPANSRVKNANLIKAKRTLAA